MQLGTRLRMRIVTALLTLGWAASLGCNDILGFHEGKPFPDAGPSDSSSEAAAPTPEAGSDAEAGVLPEVDGGCPQGYRHCGSSCVPANGCCESMECPSGESCVGNFCSCNEGTKRCGARCIPSSQCCDAP
jgi:hypothetical protein